MIPIDIFLKSGKTVEELTTLRAARVDELIGLNADIEEYSVEGASSTKKTKLESRVAYITETIEALDHAIQILDPENYSSVIEPDTVGGRLA